MRSRISAFSLGPTVGPTLLLPPFTAPPPSTASFLYVISIMTVEGGQKKFEGGKSFSHKTKRSDFSFGVGVRLQLENETVFVSSVGAPEEREGQ